MYNSRIFTNVNKYVSDDRGKVTYTGILVASKLNQKNGQDYSLVDAVDFDWNGAWIESMGETYLYTTEDLIEVINTLNRTNEIGAIQREIERIWKQINEITATYVTYSYLDEHLSTYWQRLLNFGEYIGFDNTTYTVYAYNLPTYEYLGEYYTDLLTFNDFVEEIHTNYYNRIETNVVAYNAAYEAILQVIAGADNKFDTLKEVADWILDQNVWVQVELSEILEALEDKENWPQDTYFVLDEETGEYVPVNNPNEIDTSGETIYYKKENYLVELKRLMVRVNYLDERVGDRHYNEEENYYSYSGLFLDVYNLQLKDDELSERIDITDEKAEEAKQISLKAYDLGYTAYNTAYTAYGIAYTALEQSWESIHKANLAYDMAYTAIIKVGDETIEAGYVEIEDFDDLAEFIAQGLTITYIDEEGHRQYATEPFDPDIKYYYYQEYVEGTGLTRRVEITEEKAEQALETAEIALESSYESLFHLMVNNEDSTYVKLGLSPARYNGSRDRLLSITTSEASIDRHSGEIYNDGLVNMATAFDIYSYASSWMMLYVNEDVEFPNQDDPIIDDNEEENDNEPPVVENPEEPLD